MQGIFKHFCVVLPGEHCIQQGFEQALKWCLVNPACQDINTALLPLVAAEMALLSHLPGQMIVGDAGRSASSMRSCTVLLLSSSSDVSTLQTAERPT
jgi:hypothetical protein